MIKECCCAKLTLPVEVLGNAGQVMTQKRTCSPFHQSHVRSFGIQELAEAASSLPRTIIDGVWNGGHQVLMLLPREHVGLRMFMLFAYMDHLKIFLGMVFEVFLLDMGAQVKITEIAKHLIKLNGLNTN